MSRLSSRVAALPMMLALMTMPNMSMALVKSFSAGSVGPTSLSVVTMPAK